MAGLLCQCPSTAAKALWSLCCRAQQTSGTFTAAGLTSTASAHPTPSAPLASIHPALASLGGLRKETLAFLLSDYMEQTILKIGFKSSLSMWLQI